MKLENDPEIVRISHLEDKLGQLMTTGCSGTLALSSEKSRQG